MASLPLVPGRDEDPSDTENSKRIATYYETVMRSTIVPVNSNCRDDPASDQPEVCLGMSESFENVFCMSCE